MSEAYILERDEKGRIVKGGRRLDSDTARQMAQKRWQRNRDDNAAELLKDAGYDNPNKAPTHLRLLAEKASTNTSGSVTALRAFVSEALKSSGKSEYSNWKRKGGPCPLCGSIPIPHIPPDTAEALLAILRKREEV